MLRLLLVFYRSRLTGPPSETSQTRRMVGVPGIEPGTSSLSGTRSNQLSYTPELETRRSKFEIRNSDFLRNAQVGGGRRVRTDDIQLAKLALYQLSYTPGTVLPDLI
jgi:hypothetical protein